MFTKKKKKWIIIQEIMNHTRDFLGEIGCCAGCSKLDELVVAFILVGMKLLFESLNSILSLDFGSTSPKVFGELLLLFVL